MSRQKEVATRKRDEKAMSKQGAKENLAKTPSNQKALAAQQTAKANEDLVQDSDEKLYWSFARNDDANALDAMYEGCEGRAAEMQYRYVNLRMAEKIKMLRRSEEINEHAHKRTKAKPPCPSQVIIKRDALLRLMAEESPETVVEGKSSRRYFDVWLAIDRDISWQP